MLLEIILGIFAGTITGLIPGIHINLISAILISATLPFSPTALTIFIIAMAITHTFTDFIPATYFGAPDEDTALGVLPAHKFLMRGQGHHAIKLNLLGSTLAIILSVPLFFALKQTLENAYPFLETMIPFLLAWIAIFMISKEKEKIPAIIVFVLAGFLGTATLNTSTNQPLLPLLTGLFGVPTILNSISKRSQPPEQETTKTKIQKRKIIKPTIITAIISPICSILPGIGASQAATIGSEITSQKSKIDEEQFIILLGSINTLIMTTSFTTIWLIGKSRTGAANAIQTIGTELQISKTILILIASTFFAIAITLTISKFISKRIHKINYTKISTAILILIFILVLTISGPRGILILATATALGKFCIDTRMKRSILMASLMIPTIIFYLP